MGKWPCFRYTNLPLESGEVAAGLWQQFVWAKSDWSVCFCRGSNELTISKMSPIYFRGHDDGIPIDLHKEPTQCIVTKVLSARDVQYAFPKQILDPHKNRGLVVAKGLRELQK